MAYDPHMFHIAGSLLSGGGVVWQVQGEEGNEPEGLSVNFGFHSNPPTARRARQVVSEVLSAHAPDWFRIRGKIWVLDLGKLAEHFHLEFEWLRGDVVVEPEYNVLSGTFRKDEMYGCSAW